MLIKVRGRSEVESSEITPKSVCLGRRRFLAAAAVASATAAFPTSSRRERRRQSGRRSSGSREKPILDRGGADAAGRDHPLQQLLRVRHRQGRPGRICGDVEARPWTVSGRRRCAESPAPSTSTNHQGEPAGGAHLPPALRRGLVDGDPVDRLPARRRAEAGRADSAAPSSSAFKTLLDPAQMPGPTPADPRLALRRRAAAWTRRCIRWRSSPSGLYGEVLPNQNGAPIRLVVPWKYGFKGIKSIVSISFVEQQPPTAWNVAAPSEYGFYANVNPEVDHPRWSQATERRIGEFFRRRPCRSTATPTRSPSLYAGMDLTKWF